MAHLDLDPLSPDFLSINLKYIDSYELLAAEKYGLHSKRASTDVSAISSHVFAIKEYMIAALVSKHRFDQHLLVIESSFPQDLASTMGARHKIPLTSLARTEIHFSLICWSVIYDHTKRLSRILSDLKFPGISDYWKAHKKQLETMNAVRNKIEHADERVLGGRYESEFTLEMEGGTLVGGWNMVGRKLVYRDQTIDVMDEGIRDLLTIYIELIQTLDREAKTIDMVIPRSLGIMRPRFDKPWGIADEKDDQ